MPAVRQSHHHHMHVTPTCVHTITHACHSPQHIITCLSHAVQVGPAGSVLGVVAYFFVFLMFESRLLLQPWKEYLKLVGVCMFLFLLGLIPYVDNFAHLGGFVYGFLISGVLVPHGPYKEVWRLTNQDVHKDKFFLVVKRVLIVVGLVGCALLFTLFFVLLYEVQTTWIGLSFLTCTPFTSTLCVDQQTFIRDRNQPNPII